MGDPSFCEMLPNSDRTGSTALRHRPSPALALTSLNPTPQTNGTLPNEDWDSRLLVGFTNTWGRVLP